MHGPMIKNREFKAAFITILLIIILFLIGLLVANHMEYEKLNTDLTRRNIAIIGSVLDKYPELELDIVGFFTKDMTEDALEKGVNIAGEYGYHENLRVNLIPVMKKYRNNSQIRIVLFSAMLILLILLIVYLVFSFIYKRLNSLVLASDNIMRGVYDIRFPEDGEGEMGKVGYAFNQMAARLQNTVLQLNEDKDILKNMISNISHQLKTPLSTLKVYNELIADETTDIQAKHEFSIKSEAQLDRMEWLINTLLKISRFETGNVTFNITVSDIVRTVKDAVICLEHKWINKNIHMDIVTQQNIILVPHDCHWMGEALENIIDNGISYTPEDGHIKIKVTNTGTTVVISVHDSGPGIPEDELPQIFDKFFQGKSNAKVYNRGSGIGLSLAKLVVENHNGIITASSDGIGACFKIVIPNTKGDDSV